MLLELLEKALRQLGSLERESSLISAVVFDEKGTIDYGLVDESGSFRALNVKRKAAPADAFRLVFHKLASSPANANADPAQPIPEGPPQLHFSGTCAKRFCLEVEKDQAGMGPERNAQEFQRAVAVLRSPPRFDNKPNTLNGYFPGLVVCQPSMGQRTLRPTRVNEIEGAILVPHVEGCGFHDIAVEACFKSTLLAASLQ
jgi:hypothetical protein